MSKTALTWILSLIYGFLVLTKCLVRIINIGRHRFFEIKQRDSEPRCLLDPVLGKHEYVKLKDTKLHYVIKGDESKPLMLFVHGFPDFWYVWKHQIKEFSQDYRVVAVDLRGYGKSDKKENLSDYETRHMVEDLYQVVKHFVKDSGKAIVVSHDWGGVLSYLLTAKYPELVSHLIVANVPHPLAFAKTIATTWKQFFMSWYMFYFQLPSLPEMTLQFEDLGFVDRFYRNGKKKLLTEEDIEAYKYVYSRPGALTHALNYYRANVGNASKQDMRVPTRITCPMLLLWGDRDLALSFESALQSAVFIDKFHLKVLKGVSHWSQLDAAEEFNANIRTFLKENWFNANIPTFLKEN